MKTQKDINQHSKVLIIHFILIVLFIIPKISYAQTAPAIEWQKCLGGASWDYAKCVLQTTDGGYVMGGYTSSSDADVSGNHSIDNGKNRGPSDAWVVKLNSSGSIEWQKCIGGSGSDYAYSIIQTIDGGYAIAGLTESGIDELSDGDVSGNHGGQDAWLVKLDSLGNLEWQKCYGGRGYDLANCIIQTIEGGFMIAGFTSSIDGDVVGNHNASDTTGNYYGDAWIVKLSASGVIEWQKCLGGTGYDEAQSIIQTSGGGYILAGWTTSTNGDVFGKHAGSRDSAADAWIVKLSSSGSIEWQKCLGGTSNDYAYSIVKTFDGGYAVAGKTNSSDGDVSGFHTPISYFFNDAWVVKLDSLGSIEWQKCLGGTSNDYAASIIQSSDKGYVLAGTTWSDNGDVSGNHFDTLYNGTNGGADVWVVKLNSSGSIAWQKCLGGHGNQEGYSIINTSDGGYTFAGWTDSNDGDVSGSHSNFYRPRPDAWVVKLNNAPSSVDITNTDFIQQKFFWIYPNPSTEQVRLELLQSLQLKQVQFFDMMGIQRYPDYHLESSSALVDIHNLSNGTYITRVGYIRKGIPGTFTLPFIVQHLKIY